MAKKKCDYILECEEPVIEQTFIFDENLNLLGIVYMCRRCLLASKAFYN